MGEGMGEGVGEGMGGKVCVVTGANTGIGRVTALELARAGARVVLACRSEERAREAVAAIRAETGSDAVESLRLDLADLADVRRAAAELLARTERLDVLVNNAGLAGQRGLTRDGFELTFGVNHLGHFLLTRLLEERLRASAPARVVTVASRAHTRARRLDWDALTRPTRTVTGLREYAVSKLANVLFSASLGRRLEGSGVTTYALHPGVVASDIYRRVPQPVRGLLTRFMISNEEGARTSLWCATAPALAAETGRYYADCAARSPSRLARDEALAEELWRRSEDWVRPG